MRKKGNDHDVGLSDKAYSHSLNFYWCRFVVHCSFVCVWFLALNQWMIMRQCLFICCKCNKNFIISVKY